MQANSQTKIQSGYFQLDQIEMPVLYARFFEQRICGFKCKGFSALFVMFNFKCERKLRSLRNNTSQAEPTY